MERKVNFCYQAINDIQATIRAIDAKIGFLMVVIFIPIAAIKEILSIYSGIAAHSQCLMLLMWLIAAVWAATIIVLFRALWSIKNPGKSVEGNDATGVFFNSAHYKMSAIDCIFNFPIKSDIDLKTAITNIPEDDADLLKELVFEKMKLEYIRDIKMRRCSVSSVLILFWVTSGVSLYIYSLMSKF
ncbi:hypothetical protein [Pseudomonas izuensis]|uniref:hypothetical protein n=1 Tax=Pseudomonas izuensis TaxID=2684212 RepID=UPI0013573C54|nr:hypothetical protein [Pseudomonas izuensis]